MIAWPIEMAKQSKLFEHIFVSTDDKEIAEISKKWDAEVPFTRPSEFAQDMSTDIEVFRHALQWFRNNENYNPDLIVHLRPTGPVRKVKKIDNAIEQLLKHSDADALRSVSLALQTPYKMWKIKKNDYLY